MKGINNYAEYIYFWINYCFSGISDRTTENEVTNIVGISTHLTFIDISTEIWSYLYFICEYRKKKFYFLFGRNFPNENE